MQIFNQNCVWQFLFVVCLCILITPIVLYASDLKVYPRIITPGTPPFNEAAFFDFVSTGDSMPHVSILALGGAQVCTIPTTNPIPIAAGWRVFWVGTDDEGNLVSPGVYVYQFEQDNKIETGTIVVAR